MKIQIDETDIKILNLLQRDAEMQAKTIGDIVRKAETTVFTRIAKLRKAGVIKGYVALLDGEKIRQGHITYTRVQLKDHSRRSIAHFEQTITPMPEVTECYHTTGDIYDFLLRIVTSDIKTYHEFLTDKILTIDTVAKTDSIVIMREAKRVTAYPLYSGH